MYFINSWADALIKTMEVFGFFIFALVVGCVWLVVEMKKERKLSSTAIQKEEISNGLDEVEINDLMFSQVAEVDSSLPIFEKDLLKNYNKDDLVG